MQTSIVDEKEGERVLPNKKNDSFFLCFLFSFL